MQLSKLFRHFGTAAALLVGTLGATSAFAQNTDLTLDGAGPGGGFIGDVAEYDLTISNAGPGHAAGVAVSGTLTADHALVDAAGCTLATDVNGDPAFPCTVAGEIIDGQAADVAIFVAYVGDNQAPGACVLSLDDVSFNVTSTTTDPNLVDNSITLTTPLDPYADIEARMSGPTNAEVGDVLTFTVSILNNGPCDTTTVAVDAGGSGNAFVVANGLLYQGATGPCASTTDDNVTCVIGDMIAGASVTYQKTYKVDSLPEDVMSAGLPNGVVAYSDLTDLNGDNDFAGTVTKVSQDVGRCSAVGLGTPMGLLAVVGLLGWRRRRAV